MQISREKYLISIANLRTFLPISDIKKPQNIVSEKKVLLTSTDCSGHVKKISKAYPEFFKSKSMTPMIYYRSSLLKIYVYMFRLFSFLLTKLVKIT